jgi:hypothetical protein
MMGQVGRRKSLAVELRTEAQTGCSMWVWAAPGRKLPVRSPEMLVSPTADLPS